MAKTERDRYKSGYSAQFYEETLLEAAALKEKEKLLRKRHVIKAENMPWENSRHGRLKHLINERMDYPVKEINMYLLVLPPGGRSGKHRHMAEEYIHILEGQGYDMHWDPDVEMTDKYYWKNKEEGVKYEWEQGDFVYIPPMTAHQHFNSDANKEARLVTVQNRVYKFLGYPEYEQLEDAPDYKK